MRTNSVWQKSIAAHLMMSQPAQTTLKNDEWVYLNVELIVDPLVSQSESAPEIVSIEVDDLTWKQIITASLKKMYGLVGQATHFDILHHTGRLLILRIQPQDESKFRNSFLSYVIPLETFVGSSSPWTNMDSYIKVNSSSPYIGLVTE